MSKDSKICKQNEWMKIINKTLRENRLCFKEANKSKYDKQEKKDFLFRENKIQILTFHEFVNKKLNYIWRWMRTFAVDMCTHLPTSFISLRQVKCLFECLDLLKVLAEMLSNNSITDQQLYKARKECLTKLKSLHKIILQFLFTMIFLFRFFHLFLEDGTINPQMSRLIAFKAF